MIFKNGRLIFPNGVRDGLDLFVEDRLITGIRPQAPAMGEQIVDLEGNYLAPGFIDVHVHGAMGFDAMQATPKAFRAICDYHASGGTTSLLLTTATSPIKTILK
jgi:N-acetylglucosamine-6-phosphate deacetylase